jgi:hypothetical protein
MRFLPLLLLLFLQTGCASLYFRAVAEPPEVPRYTLADWPYGEYWTGIVFNGKKIGYTHFTLIPAGNEEFEVLSEAVLSFHFMTYAKEVALRSRDLINHDLTIKEFSYEYNMDGNRMLLRGRATEGRLEVQITAGREPEIVTVPLDGPIYPTSVIGLYPLLQGLEIGRRYSFFVYDGETLTVDRVEQVILAYEESDLFSGQAYKLKTRLHGQVVHSWLDRRGLPLLEMSLGGIFIAGLESEDQAKQYLADAVLNKEESFLEFSLIKVDKAIEAPREMRSMDVFLSGIDNILVLPSDSWQECVPEGEGVRCRIGGLGQKREPALVNPRHLLSTPVIPSANAKIMGMAGRIVGGTNEPRGQIELLMRWLADNIAKKPVDVFSALDVLETRKAECQGHSYLFAAFARSLGIPTKIVNGLVYSEDYGGFLYHTWVESLVDGEWLVLDPILGQLEADATHIKIIEGEELADLAPLVNLIGRIRMEVFLPLSSE